MTELESPAVFFSEFFIVTILTGSCCHCNKEHIHLKDDTKKD